MRLKQTLRPFTLIFRATDLQNPQPNWYVNCDGESAGYSRTLPTRRAISNGNILSQNGASHYSAVDVTETPHIQFTQHAVRSQHEDKPCTSNGQIAKVKSKTKVLKSFYLKSPARARKFDGLNIVYKNAHLCRLGDVLHGYVELTLDRPIEVWFCIISRLEKCAFASLLKQPHHLHEICAKRREDVKSATLKALFLKKILHIENVY